MFLHSVRVKNTPMECNKSISTLLYGMLLILFSVNFLILLKNLLHAWTLITLLLLLNLLGVSALLISLKKKKNAPIITHFFLCLCSTLIVLTNMWLNNQFPLLINWLYIIPILATITLNLRGLLTYGALSGVIMLTFVAIYSATIPNINTLMSVSVALNSLLIFIMICALLYIFLASTNRYERQLKKQNIRLVADKEKLYYLSHHDSLTNLPNRTYFLEYLDQLLQKSISGKHALTLYFMDLNGFKKINDQYGHEVGDILLLEVSKRLRSCFREHDFIARLAGDEFTALITHQAQDNLPSLLVTRINKEFFKPFLIKNIRLRCSISIGIATFPTDARQAEQLLIMADRSMYKRKKIRISY